MPKGNRKERSARRRKIPNNQSDDESINDSASVISSISENRSTGEGDDAYDLAQEQYEDKICDMIDGLSQKSSQGRTNCFKSLTNAFINKSTPEFIKERYFTIADSIERSLKRGGDSEKTAAAELATVVSVQLGGYVASEEIFQLLKPVLLTIICDTSAEAPVRAMCCKALSQITFLSGVDVYDSLLIMQKFESIFSGSYLKGDRSKPNVTAETATLHAAALSAWSLLFTMLAPCNIGNMINSSESLPALEKLSELLESSHLDVRMAAGEALAIVFELGREEDSEFEETFAEEIIETLKELATDSNKYRSKKDRKQQRASFRDILQFFEEDVFISGLDVRFGREKIDVDTWARRRQYESLCNILGPSINVHLAENELLREIFQMSGPPAQMLQPHAQNQVDRYRRRIVNTANSKARTVSRGKNRNKRLDY